MRLCGTDQAKYHIPVRIALTLEKRLDGQALKLQVHRCVSGVEIDHLRQVLRFLFQNQNPCAGVGMVGQPSHLVGPKVHRFARGRLQLDKMKPAVFVAKQDVGHTRHGPRFKPSRYNLPRSLLQPRLHHSPKVALALCCGCWNCLLLRE